jgi:hypothetical protein
LEKNKNLWIGRIADVGRQRSGTMTIVLGTQTHSFLST